MEKKYLEIYSNLWSIKPEDQKLIGAFENVRDFTEEPDKLEFDADEGHIIARKDSRGVWTARVFGEDIHFTSYRLVGRRTILRKVDKSYLGHTAERRAKEDKIEAAQAKFEEEKAKGEYEDWVYEEVEKDTNNFRNATYTYAGTYHGTYHSAREAKPVVELLKKFYEKVTLRKDGSGYFPFCSTLKDLREE